jgi:hypothetical protein
MTSPISQWQTAPGQTSLPKWIELDVGMAGREVAEPRDEPPRAERRQQGDGQHAAGTAVRHELEGGGFGLVEQDADGDRVDLSGLGQDQPLLDAAKQRPPHELLELSDLPAHGTLGDVQLTSGPSEAQMTRRSIEALERGERRQDASHRVDEFLE